MSCHRKFLSIISTLSNPTGLVHCPSQIDTLNKKSKRRVLAAQAEIDNAIYKLHQALEIIGADESHIGSVDFVKEGEWLYRWQRIGSSDTEYALTKDGNRWSIYQTFPRRDILYGPTDDINRLMYYLYDEAVQHNDLQTDDQLTKSLKVGDKIGIKHLLEKDGATQVSVADNGDMSFVVGRHIVSIDMTGPRIITNFSQEHTWQSFVHNIWGKVFKPDQIARAIKRTLMLLKVQHLFAEKVQWP